MREPIAIIGMGCRFPGSANNPRQFWELMKNSVDAITDVPADRFDIEKYYDPTPQQPGKVATRQGGFVDEVVNFDADFFGISPREAEYIDPQQRLLLEVTWEALEDAGLVPSELAGSQAGVFIGMWTSDYEDRMYAAIDDINLYTTIGGGRHSASGRVSYSFDFRGPSMTVDTACSSSLVAAHLACQSLWNGESELAVVGGANLILMPEMTIGYSRSGVLSPDGRSKFGDASANGYVRSEGVGVVVLKPLSKALADRDPIYALIRGGAVNNDGRSSELLVAPGADAQVAMLLEAYRVAGVDPAAVQYIEAHGTGTRIGDPVELTALGKVLGGNRPADRPCILGSVKTNIGHAEAASGIAGLIKAALCLQHRAVPANLHFNTPNPKIAWEQMPFVLQREFGPLPDNDGPILAGVNSFGITGTNAHIVLEEYIPQPAVPPQVETDRPYVLPLSARTAQGLHDLAGVYQAVLDDENLYDLCYTAGTRRTHHRQRLAVVARTSAEMADQIAAFMNGEQRREVAVTVSTDSELSARRIVFVFPGQGGQWAGMAQQLVAQEPVFREAFEACQQAMAPYINWSLLEALETPAAFEEMDKVQPLLFAVQVALADLWQSWGIVPDAVIGHSMGEVAGAYIAGAISLEDAAHVICRRSQLMQQVSGKGAMAVVELTFDEAQAVIAGYEGQLSIAVSNGPRSTVIAGDPAALNEVLDMLKAQEVFCRLVKISVASHSTHMDPLRPELVHDLAGMQPVDATIPVYSTVTGALHPGSGFDATYWGDNLRQPVRFAAAVQQALADGCNTFIEIGPHPVLLAAVEQSVQALGAEEIITLPSMRREEDEQTVMLASLGGLYAAGYPVDWSCLYPAGNVQRLPTYPWQRERFWLNEADQRDRYYRPRSDNLLGQRLHLADATGRWVWENRLDRSAFPYAYDYLVQGVPVLPASAYVDMVLAAAREIFGEAAWAVTQFNVEKVLFLPQDGPGPVMQVALADEGIETAFRIYSQTDDAWTLHASGAIRAVEPEAVLPAMDRAQGGQPVSSAEIYQALEARGIQFGPGLQRLAQLWQADGVVFGHINPQAQGLRLEDGFQLAALTSSGGVPLAVDEVRVYDASAAAAGLAYAPDGSDDSVQNVVLLDHEDRILAEMLGVRLAGPDSVFDDALENWFYELQWRQKPHPESASDAAKASGTWLIFADAAGVGAQVAAQLQAAGQQAIVVQHGPQYALLSDDQAQVQPSSREDMRRLLQDVFEVRALSCQGILHLWSLDVPDEVTAQTLDDAQHLGALSVLALVQAIDEAGWQQQPRVWLATSGTQQVAGSATTGVAQSPVWGLGHVMAEEHPELWGGLIDVEPVAAVADIAQQLTVEILSPDGEDQVALYGGARYVARLVRHRAAPDSDAAFRLHADGTYLVTGGLGALGLLVARWMVQQGARRLILMGRTPLPPRAAWKQLDPHSDMGRKVAAVRELERMGASVHLAAVDVADETALVTYLEQFADEGWPSIRGVVHAAGALEGRLMAQMDEEAFSRILRPKVTGGWLLHQLLPDVDFFILFSSITSILGQAGQASYAAANAFLDALAHYRRASGAAALSINWAVWADLGVAGTNAPKFDSKGIYDFAPERGLAALEQILRHDHSAAAQVMVMPVDWAQFRASLFAHYLHLADEIETASAAEADHSMNGADAPESQEQRISVYETLMELSPENRLPWMQTYLQNQVAGVLRLSPSRVELSRPLGTLGLDSLMSLELRNRLEADLGLALPATLAWNYPTVAAMAPYLANKIGVPLGAEAAPAADEPAAVDEKPAMDSVLEDLEELSDEEALRRLLGQ